MFACGLAAVVVATAVLFITVRLPTELAGFVEHWYNALPPGTQHVVASTMKSVAIGLPSLVTALMAISLARLRAREEASDD